MILLNELSTNAIVTDHDFFKKARITKSSAAIIIMFLSQTECNNFLTAVWELDKNYGII